MNTRFTGLSAFPLTPIHDDVVDEAAFAGLIERLVAAGVDSITALGSTGSYAYLIPEERARVARLAVEHAGSTPMIVYDNPGTTHFTFTNDLYARITQLPGIVSIKIPGVPTDPHKAREHVAGIRAVIPEHVTIGVSGDAFAATGLNAGCEAWYSVIGGTLPEPALRITRAAQAGHAGDAVAESERLAPLWALFAEYGGSLRVTAAIAEHLGLAPQRCLPLPIQGLTGEQRARVADVVDQLGLA